VVVTEGKRTFDLLRLMILISLKEKPLTINQISRKTGINWRTVDNHITYLLGSCLLKQVMFCDYVKIVEITPAGLAHIESNLEHWKEVLA